MNQSSGLDSGFGNDEDGNIAYDKPWRSEAASSIYRPTRKAGNDWGEDDYDKIKSMDKFRADRGFSGADVAEARSGPVQFEREQKEDDPLFGLNKFLSEAKSGSKRGDRRRDDDESSRGHKRSRN